MISVLQSLFRCCDKCRTLGHMRHFPICWRSRFAVAVGCGGGEENGKLKSVYSISVISVTISVCGDNHRYRYRNRVVSIAIETKCLQNLTLSTAL